MALLMVGSKGPEVEKVCKQLKGQGYWPFPISSNYTERLAGWVSDFQGEHIREDKDPLGVDGKVGTNTRWALAHPSGKHQRRHIAPAIPEGLNCKRMDLLEIALSQHGVCEIPNGSNRSTKPHGGVDKYLPDWFKTNPGPPWCNLFVSWVVKEHFGRHVLGERVAACRKSKSLSDKLGCFKSKKTKPIPGDAFLMLYMKNGRMTGKGHIGFILGVSPDGKFIYTVEGNCGNRVAVGKRAISDKSIVGWIDYFQGKAPSPKFKKGNMKAKNVGKHGTR